MAAGRVVARRSGRKARVVWLGIVCVGVAGCSTGRHAPPAICTSSVPSAAVTAKLGSVAHPPGPGNESSVQVRVRRGQTVAVSVSFGSFSVPTTSSSELRFICGRKSPRTVAQPQGGGSTAFFKAVKVGKATVLSDNQLACSKGCMVTSFGAVVTVIDN